jgi:hypothetical protein
MRLQLRRIVAHHAEVDDLHTEAREHAGTVAVRVVDLPLSGVPIDASSSPAKSATRSRRFTFTSPMLSEAIRPSSAA